MKIKLLITVVFMILLSGCRPEEWPGTGSDLTLQPQTGGYKDTGGAHFGGWVNNAWGSASTLVPTIKDHPPLQGVRVCVEEYPSFPCAITDANGRYDLYGIPKEDVTIVVSLPGYYGITLPYDASQGDYVDNPAVELASMALQDQLYTQLNISEQPGSGAMNFFVINKANHVPDPEAEDHAELAKPRWGVAFKYRKVSTDENGKESYGSWSNPSSWILGKDVVYLDNNESPATGSFHTSNSGLGLAMNLEPGLYEIEADDTNYRNGLGTLATIKRWQCRAIDKGSVGVEPHYIRAKVVEGHLADARIVCKRDS